MTYEKLTYEGFAPHRVPVIVECLTDNVNRTVTNIRMLFRKGQLGTSGSVSWDFDYLGMIEATPNPPQRTPNLPPLKPVPVIWSPPKTGQRCFLPSHPIWTRYPALCRRMDSPCSPPNWAIGQKSRDAGRRGTRGSRGVPGSCRCR